ncbi:membrane hypothetical protein [Candidatus Sulfotelmatomonas gaucii]|uniref:Uncharacterized protein n=1 Tax=Candidatus Sulfuritelmatomonas gaucii TaxID=2043161 RepID=A0A2N9L5H7_9BACT|nr:membrane hypothetical protein [Candidatus Sulfotelmatomonas gaucii]
MKTGFRLVVCWIGFAVALILSGFVDGVLHLHAGPLPGGVSVQTLFLTQLVAGVVLVVGLWPLARSLAAPAALRVAAFTTFLLLAFGLNGIIEALKFTDLLDEGISTAVAFYVCLAVILGAALGLLFGTAGQLAGLPHRSWPAWTWRVAAAWLGWPVVYLFFGMCIAPIVTPYYNAGIAGLRIPSMSVVVEMQLLRSLFFLAGTLPFVALSKVSRRSLWLTLAVANAFTVGFYGIASATFLPVVLRVTHSVEMTCDAFAYAGLLVLLFTAPAVKLNASDRREQAAPSSAPAFHSR